MISAIQFSKISVIWAQDLATSLWILVLVFRFILEIIFWYFQRRKRKKRRKILPSRVFEVVHPRLAKKISWICSEDVPTVSWKAVAKQRSLRLSGAGAGAESFPCHPELCLCPMDFRNHVFLRSSAHAYVKRARSTVGGVSTDTFGTAPLDRNSLRCYFTLFSISL